MNGGREEEWFSDVEWREVAEDVIDSVIVLFSHISSLIRAHYDQELSRWIRV